jgi:hypothetical protein
MKRDAMTEFSLGIASVYGDGKTVNFWKLIVV